MNRVDETIGGIATNRTEVVVQAIAEQSAWFAQWLLRQDEWLQDKFAQDHEWFARWREVEGATLERKLAEQTEVLRQYAHALVEKHRTVAARATS